MSKLLQELKGKDINSITIGDAAAMIKHIESLEKQLEVKEISHIHKSVENLQKLYITAPTKRKFTDELSRFFDCFNTGDVFE